MVKNLVNKIIKIWCAYFQDQVQKYFKKYKLYRGPKLATEQK